MSEDETMHGTAQPDAGLTQEYPTIASGLMTPEGASGDLSLEGDDDDEWPVRGPARGIRLALPTAGIVVVLLVAAGFWSGAVIEKNHGSSAGSGAASALAARFRSAQTAAAGTSTTGTGTTVVVQGATGKSGDVTATSISATAPGVTATG